MPFKGFKDGEFYCAYHRMEVTKYNLQHLKVIDIIKILPDKILNLIKEKV